ncbi:hypothetical protein ZWY2020_018163 [Hordeum vulgare]|nr:hypothetical protein ZWY2020_018163 [Hordeum vulgare]
MATGGSSSNQGEEHPLPKEAKGTTSAPFDGGAFTLKVLARAGKGDMGRRRFVCSIAVVECEGAAGHRQRRKGQRRRGAGLKFAAVTGGRSSPAL